MLSAQLVGCSDDGAGKGGGQSTADAGADVSPQDTGASDAGQDATDAQPSADAGETADAAVDSGTSDTGSDTGPADVGADAEPDAIADAGPDTADAGPAPIDDLDPTGGHWSTNYSMPGLQGPAGARGYVLAADPQGNGFYVGGNFAVAGGAVAANIAHWDGSQWQEVGASPLSVKVHALAATPNGELYAGGEGGGGGGIGIGGSNSIEKWDGTSWATFADIGGGFGTEVDAIRILSDGRIAVGGQFGSVDTATLDNFAVYDGANWQQLGSASPDGRVQSILEMSDGRICLGGDFTHVGTVEVNHVACWDGSQWKALDAGLNAAVSVLREWNGDVLAGGGFSVPGATGSSIGLARWDGTSWKGVSGGVAGGSLTNVRALAFGPTGQLYVGGTFAGAGGMSGVAAANVAVLDNGTWKALGTGVFNTVGVVGPGVTGVNDFLVDAASGKLIVTGFFSNVGDQFSLNVGQWTIGATQNTGWAKLVGNGEFAGADMAVVTLGAAPDGTVYATGRFTTIGSRQISHVARYQQGHWQKLPDQVDGDVGAIVFDSAGRAYFGGNMTVTTASQTLHNLAIFDGTTWSGLSTAVPGEVVALAMGPNDELYAATTGGGAFSVHQWTGSTWQQLGATFANNIQAMAVLPNGDLYIGGQFDQDANGTALSGIARWDGSGWVPVGGGIDKTGYVSKMTVYDGKLLVIGHFGEVGGSTPAGSVALWDGTAWDALNGGIPPRFPNGPAPTVTGVVAKANGFFVTGTFPTVGPLPVNYIAWYDGQDWFALGSGLSDMGQAMAIADHQLFVGGLFTAAGGNPSYHIGVWDYRP